MNPITRWLLRFLGVTTPVIITCAIIIAFLGNVAGFPAWAIYVVAGWSGIVLGSVSPIGCGK